MSPKGFSVRGAEHLRVRFSKRARQVEQLAEAFAKEKGRKPSKRKVEILVKESRADKLSEASNPEMRTRQRRELTGDEQARLDAVVNAARQSSPQPQRSHGLVRTVLESALRHVYERSSVVREGAVLSAALELHPEFFRWRELREAGRPPGGDPPGRRNDLALARVRGSAHGSTCPRWTQHPATAR